MVNSGIFLSTIIINLLVFTSVLCTIKTPTFNPGIITQSKSLGECQSCTLFIDSFQKGLERTTRGKYEGGDAAWEEEKLKKSYKRSEMRLIDIQDGICKEVAKHSVQCHHIAEKAEEFIEEWWAQNQDESDDLFTYICIDKLKFCCPKHHFGKDCSPCPGDHSKLCNGNGKCRGDGTRKGNGTCLCDVGYMGENCDECSTGFYLSYKDDKMLCSKCHNSCMGGCRSGTPKDCVACKIGYIFDLEEGCVDVNECDDLNKCSTDQFCQNTRGSYECIPCDKSCKGCHSDGPDMCRKCADGYSKQGELCIANREDDDDKSEILTSTRYMTYIGLLIATAISLGMSVSLGSFVGMLVISYIVGAEYYCMINGHTGLVNMKDFDLMQLFRT